MNSEVFYTWIRQELLPQLPNRGVVVMDNASFPNRLDIQPAIRDAGHLLLLLPPYSLQLNPIEPKWDQAKAFGNNNGVPFLTFLPAMIFNHFILV